jgi:hypothetical protein
MEHVAGGVCVPFSDALQPDKIVRAIAERWLMKDQWKVTVPLDEKAFEPYTARHQAKILVDFFRMLIRIDL